MDVPSGKFVLRLDPKLHASLQLGANRKGLSLNQFCVERLLGGGDLRGNEPFQTELIRALYRATQIHPNDLEGLILFGSWARGEQREGSDIDLLVVLREGVSIKRDLYRQWEKVEENTSVEPSIVALPSLDQPFSGLWAEVALDGIILFECSQKIRHYLYKARQAIANGSLRRERAHGQNYWVHEPKGAQK